MTIKALMRFMTDPGIIEFMLNSFDKAFIEWNGSVEPFHRRSRLAVKWMNLWLNWRNSIIRFAEMDFHLMESCRTGLVFTLPCLRYLPPVQHLPFEDFRGLIEP